MDDRLEPPETIAVSLLAQIKLSSIAMCTFVSYFELESRIILDLPTTTITILDPGMTGTSLDCVYDVFSQACRYAWKWLNGDYNFGAVLQYTHVISNHYIYTYRVYCNATALNST